MTVEEFFARFNGQGIDFDHAFGYQCMDLAEEYNQDVVGAPRLGGNVIDVWTNFPANRYTKTGNTPDNFPNEGDLILWTSRSSDIALIYSCNAVSRWLSDAITCPIRFCCSLNLAVNQAAPSPAANGIAMTASSSSQSQRVFAGGCSDSVIFPFVVILGYPPNKPFQSQ
jgi:hypothetical protein